MRRNEFSTTSVFSKETRNPNNVELVCPHCGSRDFHYRIRTDFTVYFTTPNNNFDVYEREPAETREFESIYCSECGKRAFTRKQLADLGVTIPI